ncbi:MAG: hypothetical protein U0234_11105 [Sandaracinus sp.]
MLDSTPLRSLIGSIPLFLALGCGGSTPATPDAAVVALDAGDVDAAAPRRLAFTAGPAYPAALAYATATILPVGTQRYLYVVGGADATATALNTVTAACARAEIHADGTLGDWEDAGAIDGGSGPFPLVGHGALRLNGDLGEVGIAVAGGGGPSGALPFVLSGFVQSDGTLGAWGRYDPTLDGAQSFGAFVPFEAHQLALVGGLTGPQGLDPTDRVVVAAIMNGTTSPTWRTGPSLPVPRFGHAWTRWNDQLYVVGGENASGGVAEVLRATRDAGLEVNGWAIAGTLLTTTSFPAVLARNDELWILGGIDGGRATGSASSRVARAPIGADGHLGDFARVAGGDLPLPIAASAVAYDDETGHVYLVGGLTGAPLAATDRVIVGTLP